LAQYESDLESGIGLMKGQLLEPDQTAAIGENLVAAAAALGAISSDGDPLFDPSERAEKISAPTGPWRRITSGESPISMTRCTCGPSWERPLRRPWNGPYPARPTGFPP
jgi:hypothetical protein